MKVLRTDETVILGDHETRIGDQERSGSDPKQWIYVGSGAPAPGFQNGFHNVGGSQVPMRYRFLRTLDPDLDPSIYTPNAIELQGAVTGGTLGQTIFTLLFPGYRPDGSAAWTPVTRDADIHVTACDEAGAFAVVTVLTNGDVVYGFV